MTVLESLFFDRFNSCPKMRLFKPVALPKCFCADDFDRIRDDDGDDPMKLRECPLADLDDRDSVKKTRNLNRTPEFFVTPGNASAPSCDFPPLIF